jgi:beta-mannosidase
MFVRQPLNWTVGFSSSPDATPQEFVPATVPGAVQLDWARAKDWPPHYVADNWKEYGWMEDVYWTYRSRIERPTLVKDQRLYFVCNGVDYQFEVRVAEKVLHRQEGMFTPFEIDLTDAARYGDELRVIISPAPKSCVKPADRNQANQSCKPAVSYSWDFHPRLIPLGIWEETWLEVRPATHMQSAEVRYGLSSDNKQAQVQLELALKSSGPAQVRWQLIDPAGKVVIDQTQSVEGATPKLEAALQHPQLWWPNGQGSHALYLSRVDLLDGSGAVVQTRESKVGFRRVRLVMAPGAWNFPADKVFPKGPSNYPITLEINGREIFCKGSNFVAPDIFPGTITAETYRPLLDLAKNANMNMLRLWGGAIINKEAFYEQCDERGLMIWQEFPLACNRYEGTPAYLRVLDQESKSIIRRLRPHACVVLWCGGNELFNNWSLMTNQDLALRLLNRNCYDLDPQRPYLMTSPQMGMGHGHYLFREPGGREVFQMMVTASCTAYTEFGVPGPSNVEVLKSFIPEKDLFPPKRGTAWATHHAFDAWGGDLGSWLMQHQIEDYFGPMTTLEQLVEHGQLLQGEGYKCLFEEARRQKPAAAMALNWCFNEPWPTAANNSVVNWPAKPKAALKAIGAACRPVLASARIPKFRWKGGEIFNPEIWLLNDSPLPVAGGSLQVHLLFDDQKISLLNWEFANHAANTNLPGPVVRFQLPNVVTTRMKLLLQISDRPECASEYVLVYQPEKKAAPKAGAAALNL